MEKEQIIKKLEGIIEISKALIHSDMDEEWNKPWREDVEALEAAIEAIRVNNHERN